MSLAASITRLPLPHRIWIGIFLIWSMLLSGLLEGVIGSPGLAQLLELRSFLETRQKQGETLREKTRELEETALRMEKNRAAQLREIRKILGYTAPDELIFDFSSDPDT